MAFSRRVRGYLFAAVVAAMIAVGMKWSFVQLPLMNLAEARSTVASIPDRSTPEYPKFLAEVKSRTAAGAKIAILVPRSWQTGYDYAYYRATYLLPGRIVIPLIDGDDSAHPERLADVEFVAAWQMPFDAPGFVPMWRGHDGVLARRTR